MASAYPPRWVVIAAAGFFLVALLSTLASPIRTTALWGLEQGRDGQSLLSTASVLAVFVAIALRLRTPAQAWRLAGALAVGAFLSSLYVLFQAAGLDPFDLERFLPGRVVGSFGNPIFAGAALLQGVPFVLWSMVVLGGRDRRAAWLAATAVAFGVVMTAIALTLARGAWLGTGVALVGFALAAWRVVPWQQQRRMLAGVGAAAVVGVVVLLLVNAPRSGESALNATADRVGSVSSALGSGISGRADIWQASAEVAADRPWFAFDDGGPAVLRHLLGYGPDSFVFVYPLREEPALGETIRLTKDGHNQHVHAAVEQGLLGLLAALAVSLVPLGTGGYVLVRRSGAYPLETRLLLAALLAAMAGQAAEQLVGVAQLSDTLIYWAMLGLLVALPRTLEPEQPGGEPGPFLRVRPALVAGPLALAVGGVLIAVVATQAVGPLLAARDAELASDARSRGDGVTALERMASAVDRAPGESSHRLALVSLFDEALKLSGLVEDKRELLASSVALLEQGLDRSPLSLAMNARLATERLALADLGGEAGAEDALEAFERTAALLPNYWQPKRSLAVALLSVGRPDEALVSIDEALVLLGDDSQTADLSALREQALEAIATGQREQ